VPTTVALRRDAVGRAGSRDAARWTTTPTPDGTAGEPDGSSGTTGRPCSSSRATSRPPRAVPLPVTATVLDVRRERTIYERPVAGARRSVMTMRALRESAFPAPASRVVRA
jgi:hypothetical protein